MTGYRNLCTCLACGGRDLRRFLDLGSQPLANDYHDGTRELPHYPLAVNHCADCDHSQLTVAVEPSVMFDHYHYVSDTTQTLRDYFAWFADRTVEKHGACNVLEIACNSGALLEQFAKRGCQCLGVDPAVNLRPLSAERGIEVVVDYWGSDCAERHVEFIGRRFNVIVAMNVLAHTPRPLSFLLAAKSVLADGGSMYLQTSQCNWLANGEFDSVYHEHLSYFSEASFRWLAMRAGLWVANFEHSPVHGGSFLVELKRGPRAAPLDMGSKARTAADQTRLIVDDYRARGFTVVGYGAAAKGNTFLNYADIKLDYVVDDNPLKQGLMTPGTNIPIVESSHLAELKRPFGPLLIVALAWNFFDEIRARVKAMRPKVSDKFLTYFPQVAVRD